MPALTIGAGCIFAFLSGSTAYMVAGALLVVAHAVPHIAFARGVSFRIWRRLGAAWLSVFAAAAWQYFVVRRQLRKSESDKARYQQAIHFVTHEMRSPLTAIQGSSELMGRYNLTMPSGSRWRSMINSESKRLARMIQTFLDVERLTDGQMELRSEVFEAADVIRALPGPRAPAGRAKTDRIPRGRTGAAQRLDRRPGIDGVRGLQSAHKRGEVFAGRDGCVTRICFDAIRIAAFIRPGPGNRHGRKRIAEIFQKFYRTKKAEASGEVGTGIGLSIVEQIVNHHGGQNGGRPVRPGRGRVLRWYCLPTRLYSGVVLSARVATYEGYIHCHVFWLSKMTTLSGTTVVTFLELEGYEVDAVVFHARSIDSVCSKTPIRSSSPTSIWTNAPGSTYCKPRRASNPGCAVILMTGRGTMETVMRATQGGAFDYIAKPFELDVYSKR